MPIVEDTIVINGPQAEVFALAIDYRVRLDWDPFVRDYKFLNGASVSAPGVHVWVKAWTGLTMEVEIINQNPPHLVAMNMIRGPFFFNQFAGSWLFKKVEPQATQVIFRYSFTTRFASVRSLLDRIVSAVFRRDIRLRLRALKRAAEETLSTSDTTAHLPSVDF